MEPFTSVAVDSEFACPFFALDFLEIAPVSFHTSFRFGAFFEVAYNIYYICIDTEFVS